MPFFELPTGLRHHVVVNLADKPNFFRDRNEVRWRNQTKSGMFPAQKGLKARNFACIRVDDRLVSEMEIALLNREAKFGLESKASNRRFVHGGVEDRIIAMACTLGRVHRDISIAEQIFRGRARAKRLRYTDTNRRKYALMGELDRCPHGFKDAFRDLHSRSQSRRVLDQNSKFVTADPSKGRLQF
jgi:hypothetical protein